MNKKRTVAIVLSAGSGKRMGSSVKKQYMEIHEKPIIFYALKAFQDSFVDEIVMVVSPGDIAYCKKEIVDLYGFHKVTAIVEGGKERYHSVFNGIKACGACDYIYIHDGARPMLNDEILQRLQSAVEKYGACVAGMPVKDTIKIADRDGMVDETPDRSLVWMVQTPQVFDYPVIRDAYEKLIQEESSLLEKGISITDDAMVVETFQGKKVKLVEGDYKNIKITTPEDIKVAEGFLQ